MRIEFPLLGKSVDVEEGALVSDACLAAGVPLNLVCGGNGTCNKCRVDIMEDGQRKNVLGCRHVVADGMQVLVSDEQAAYQLLESVAEEPFDFNPPLKNVLVSKEKLVTPMGSYDFSRLEAVLSEEAGLSVDMPDYDTLLLFERRYRTQGGKFLNVVLLGRRIVDLVVSDSRIPLYAVAVDIGTTSVVAFLYNMATGRLVGHCSALNGQSAFGADVVSRIEHAGTSAENLADERAAIERTVDELIGRLCAGNAVAREAVYEVVYCGNSTMQHLFLGLDPSPLGKMPFTGVVAQEVTVPASRMDIGINPRGQHVFMPLLGGYVGADTTACLLELPRDRKMRMMIDLGTNCEVSLGIDARTMVASTACGPALEGAGLSMGMRAQDGAIESVAFEDGAFAIGVIGDIAPIGFCGSGIIDMIAVLLREGAITKKGAFVKGSKLAAHPWKDRIRESEDKGRYFVLVDAADNPNGVEISITLKDIRAIQLAKGAIYTGCEILADSYGIKMSDIEDICLAGAFGNYIDIENATEIGLIPHIEGVSVHSIGNGAGLGVQRYLLSASERERAEKIRRSTSHVELADDPSFTDVYLKSMSFGVHSGE